MVPLSEGAVGSEIDEPSLLGAEDWGMEEVPSSDGVEYSETE